MPSPTFTLESVAQAICAASGHTFGGGINQGSFKETFLAVRGDGAKLALKVLRPGYSSERNEREVEAMKRCSHPNIIALLELAEFDHAGGKYTYLIEKYMEGGTLEDRIKRGLLNRAETIALGDELIRALAHIAEKDLVHRDFKPANILYAAQGGGEALVGDFGIVRDLRKESLTKTFVLPGPGTPFFAAPEQLNNEKSMIDWRTDQFAIGVTLAFAHFGVHPYREEGEDDGKAIARVASRSGSAAKFIREATTAKLPVLVKMVSRWPAERFRTPEILLEEWKRQAGEC
jgi:serine/threonine protein kinase